MVKRPSDIMPPVLLQELKRLNSLGRPWYLYGREPGSDEYQYRYTANTWLGSMFNTGTEISTAVALSEWLKGQPKLVHVTDEQFQALSQVDINLELKDVKLPYPTAMVCYRNGRCALVHTMASGELIVAAQDAKHKCDVTSFVRQRDGRFVEETLRKYDGTVTTDEAAANTLEARVAINVLLAMTNFGFQAEFMFPAEAKRDKQLSRERTPRGRGGSAASAGAPAPPVPRQNCEAVAPRRRPRAGRADGAGAVLPLAARPLDEAGARPAAQLAEAHVQAACADPCGQGDRTVDNRVQVKGARAMGDVPQWMVDEAQQRQRAQSAQKWVAVVAGIVWLCGLLAVVRLLTAH